MNALLTAAATSLLSHLFPSTSASSTASSTAGTSTAGVGGVGDGKGTESLSMHSLLFRQLMDGECAVEEGDGGKEDDGYGNMTLETISSIQIAGMNSDSMRSTGAGIADDVYRVPYPSPVTNNHHHPTPITITHTNSTSASRPSTSRQSSLSIRIDPIDP
jgi:hypothetical protein